MEVLIEFLQYSVLKKQPVSCLSYKEKDVLHDTEITLTKKAQCTASSGIS